MMNIGNIISANSVMLLLLLFLNYMFLHNSFRRLKINSENHYAIKRFKRKWRLIFLTDILFYSAVFFIILLIISNGLSKDITRSIGLIFITSLMITCFYMIILERVMDKLGKNTFGKNYGDVIDRGRDI